MTTLKFLDRLDALERAVKLAEGRSDVVAAQQAVAHARERLGLAGDQTVVAIAGATGSGKSSLFNALSGTQLAAPGVMRPTTSTAMAASFGVDATGLLDWLGVECRHRVSDCDPRLSGLVLVDLTDHDSVREAHRTEVDRLVRGVDQIIWVVDPQKYADSVLHNDYLRKLVGHASVIRVVLNQIDLLSEDDLQRCLQDLRRILDGEGLKAVPIYTASAKTGAGVDELRSVLAGLISSRASLVSKLDADISAAAHGLVYELGDVSEDQFSEDRVDHLNATLAGAAGVDIVAQTVADSVLVRGTRTVGSPLLSWVRKTSPDPMRRLVTELDDSDEISDSQPQMSLVTQQARISSALRAIGAESAGGLPTGWRDAVLDAGRRHLDQVTQSLDSALARTELSVNSEIPWWRPVRVVQRVLTACVILGLVWQVVNLLLYIGGWGNAVLLGIPTILIVGGAALSFLIDAWSRISNHAASADAAERVRTALNDAVAQIAESEVISPVRSELARHKEAVQAAKLAQQTGDAADLGERDDSAPTGVAARRRMDDSDVPAAE